MCLKGVAFYKRDHKLPDPGKGILHIIFQALQEGRSSCNEIKLNANHTHR